MTLVKLENGDYINTNLISKILSGHGPNDGVPVLMAGDKDFTWITDADKDCILGIMKPQPQITKITIDNEFARSIANEIDRQDAEKRRAGRMSY